MARSRSFYASDAWKRARTAYLKRHPLCEMPGCRDVAVAVDHIQAIRRGGFELDPRNFRALCKSCHSRKTAQVDGGMGNRPKSHFRAIGCDENGTPYDETHPWNRPK